MEKNWKLSSQIHERLTANEEANYFSFFFQLLDTPFSILFCYIFKMYGFLLWKLFEIAIYLRHSL